MRVIKKKKKKKMERGAARHEQPCASEARRGEPTERNALGARLHGCEEGRCKATWRRESKLPWRKAGPPKHLDDIVDSDQWVVNKELNPGEYS